MRPTSVLRLGLSSVSVVLWSVSLDLVPFGSDPPGIYVLIIVCSIGLLYPPVLPFAILNYWFVILLCGNFALCNSRKMGVVFLVFFSACVLSLVIEHYVNLNTYTGELRLGAIVWMLALALAGVASVVDSGPGSVDTISGCVPAGRSPGSGPPPT